MTEADRLDDRGRLTIRREYRERLGGRVVQILTPRGVLVAPVGGKLVFPKGFDALTASGESEAEREVAERLARSKKTGSRKGHA